MGIVDCCKDCGRVKWAGWAKDCDSCRARKSMTEPPIVLLTAEADKPPEKQ